MNYGWIKLTTQQAADFAAIRSANPNENWVPVLADSNGDKWISAEMVVPVNRPTYPLYAELTTDIYETMVDSSSAGQMESPTWPPPPDI